MHKAEVLVIFVALAVAAVGVYYLGPAFTGFVIKESSYSDKLNIVVASNGTYTWVTRSPKIAWTRSEPVGVVVVINKGVCG